VTVAVSANRAGAARAVVKTWKLPGTLEEGSTS
jgi:hypothetical protein